MHTRCGLRDLTRLPDGRWYTLVENFETRRKTRVVAKFVFLGAGGGALPLLQKSGIPEGSGVRRIPGERAVVAVHESRGD